MPKPKKIRKSNAIMVDLRLGDCLEILPMMESS